MRKARLYEHPEEPILISTNGRNSSNAFGDIGELESHFQRNGGYAQEVRDVTDARNIRGNTGQPQDEYNYGIGTPGVASLFNTFDFKYPAELVGPFAGFKKGGKINVKNKIKK